MSLEPHQELDELENGAMLDNIASRENMQSITAHNIGGATLYHAKAHFRISCAWAIRVAAALAIGWSIYFWVKH